MTIYLYMRVETAYVLCTVACHGNNDKGALLL